MKEFTLIQLTAEQQALEQELIDNGGELTPETEAAMRENAALIAAKVDGYHAVLRKFEMAEAGLDAEIKRLTALKKTAQAAQKNIKSHLAYAMQATGTERIDGTLCKLSFRKSKAVELDEPSVLAPYKEQITALTDALPDYITADFKVSKTGVKAALEAGEQIDGAAMVENYNLQIR